MPSKFTWRRLAGSQTTATRHPGSVYGEDDATSRQQRHVETPIYAPGGVFYQVPPIPLHHQESPKAAEMNDENHINSFADPGVDTSFVADDRNPENAAARTYRKKEQQMRRWMRVIPDMLGSYVSLLRETDSLRDLSAARNRKLCNGCADHTSLAVSCMYFEKIEKIELCTCKEPALQLLSLGLFPCAPYRPTLAVDMNMLEFSRSLFQNLAPNTTAWCETVEEFLDMRGFKLKTKDTLRIRFGNTLQWYSNLQDTKKLRLAEVLNLLRETRQHGMTFIGLCSASNYLKEAVLGPKSAETSGNVVQNSELANAELANAELANAESANEHADSEHAYPKHADSELPNAESANAELANAELANAELTNAESANEHADSEHAYPKHADSELPNAESANAELPNNARLPNAERPSEYLRQRCPLCFGGKNWHQPEELFDAVVCIDANFTQKRRKSQGNTPPIPYQHPETLFVSPEEVAAMQAEVETARPVKRKAAPAPADELASAYEPGMKVPSATLDECHESFTAADSNRVKASTQFFADTGLMALLCRHDRVLWLVNMTSAGEKQYYALCLLKKFFGHIPLAMRIGVLYDIGCQLHRSCVKFDFLAEVLDRITFGISVFHAYGHQWPCQIIYHPRKCEGFGLSDGEGCERFWSAIKPLIPSLRVSGYYTRLYAIDTKVRHLDKTSLSGMGQWLKRKWIITQGKKLAAAKALQILHLKNITEEVLRQEWANQVQEQTKALPRQNKSLADNEIYSIIALKESLKSYETETAVLEDMIITSNFGPGMTVFEAQASIEELKQKIKITAKSIEQKTSNLSLSDQKNLKRLLENKFLQIRMNALAVKQRIRERLRHRQYELESFGSSYRNTLNHQKLQQHAEQQIKKKEPGIQKLARTYNKVCQELERLIIARTAPRGARAPPKISLEGLFQLDVDHDIWQDDYLTNDLESPPEIPGWLGSDNIRDGIKILLQYDRCKEEEKRLIKERQSMQEWFTEEWNLANLALACSENDQDINLVYQFQTYKFQLVRLCLEWKTAVSSLPCSLPQNWGPTDDEIEEAKTYQITEQATPITRKEEEDDDTDTSDQPDNGPYYLDSDEALYNSEDGTDDFEFGPSDEEYVDYEEAELVDALEGFDLAEEFRQ